MQAQNQSSSEAKAITSATRLGAVAVIGAALIGYQIHKTPDARARLESLASLASRLGVISNVDATVVATLLAERIDLTPSRTFS